MKNKHFNHLKQSGMIKLDALTSFFLIVTLSSVFLTFATVNYFREKSISQNTAPQAALSNTSFDKLDADLGIFQDLTVNGTLKLNGGVFIDGEKLDITQLVSNSSNTTISTIGVTSLQDETGDISLAAGNGITIEGLKITNNAPNINQNTFQTIKVGDTTFGASNTQDTLTFSAGGNISIIPDTTNKKLTISGASATEATGWQLVGTNVILTDNSYKVGIGVSSPGEELTLASSAVLGWDNGSGTVDVALSRGSANRLDLASGDSLRLVSGEIQFGTGGTYLVNSSAQATFANVTATGTLFVGSGEDLGAATIVVYGGATGTASGGRIGLDFSADYDNITDNVQLSGYEDDFLIELSNGTDLALFKNEGQLQLPVTGSTGGLLIGGDTQLYRSAADILRTPDSLTVDGNFVVSGTCTGCGSGDITAVGSMTSGAAFADSTADDDWLGLGASAGRIEFDDLATDEVNILDANVGIGTTAPTSFLHVDGAATATVLSTFSRSFVDNTNAITTNTGNTQVFGLAIDEPNILIGTVTPTTSASLYISGAATEATNNYALWVDAGTVRVDDYMAIGDELPNAGASLFIARNFTGTNGIGSQLLIGGDITLTSAIDPAFLYVDPRTTIVNGAAVSFVSTARFRQPAISLLNGGTVTTAATVYIEDVPTGATNNFSFYNASGTSYFGGNVGIGTTAPGEKLEVVGNVISKGTSWTSRTSAADNNWREVTYGNGLFVAVADSGTGNRVMTSPDGINWTLRTSAADNGWRGVTYGNGLFVAVAITGVGNRVMTSPDGITWTIRTSAADNGWLAVTYGNGLFVATATSGVGNRVMTSPDGITWTIRTSAADNQWDSVTYGNGLFVAVAPSGVGNRVMTSPDGITWTSRTSAADNQWRSVTYGNGLFVAVADSGTGNRVMTSPDGITWTIRTSPADNFNSWFIVTYGNGLFVAVAQTGTGNMVMTSPDGITWTLRTSAADNAWDGVTYGNGLFVAVAAQTGVGNRVMTSGKTEFNEIFKNNRYFELTGGTSTTGVCSSLALATAPTAGTVYQLMDCTGTPAADYMEFYSVETEVETGDIVVPGTTSVITKDGETVSKLAKSTQPYQAAIIGIVSDPAKAGDFNSIGYNIKDEDNPMPLALNGRVPVKVSTESGHIKVGDYITSSSTPGVGMKGTKPGRVVGMALESFSGEGQGKILVFVNPTYFLGLTFAQDVSEDPLFSLLDSSGILNPQYSKQILSSEQVQKLIGEQAAVLGIATEQTASFSAQIASISGRFDLFEEDLNKQKDTMASIAAQLASLPIINLTKFATGSGVLGITMVNEDFAVMGNTTLANLNTIGNVTIGNNLSLSPNSINTIGEDLQIQSLKQGNVSFMNGLVTIDTTGNVVITGNVRADSLSLTKNKTVGNATIPAGTNSITINTTTINADSRIFLTLTASASGKAIFVSAKQAGTGFTATLGSEPSTADVTFDWLIVEAKP